VLIIISIVIIILIFFKFLDIFKNNKIIKNNNNFKLLNKMSIINNHSDDRAFSFPIDFNPNSADYKFLKDNKFKYPSITLIKKKKNIFSETIEVEKSLKTVYLKKFGILFREFFRNPQKIWKILSFYLIEEDGESKLRTVMKKAKEAQKFNDYEPFAWKVNTLAKSNNINRHKLNFDLWYKILADSDITFNPNYFLVNKEFQYIMNTMLQNDLRGLSDLFITIYSTTYISTVFNWVKKDRKMMTEDENEHYNLLTNTVSEMISAESHNSDLDLGKMAMVKELNRKFGLNISPRLKDEYVFYIDYRPIIMSFFPEQVKKDFDDEEIKKLQCNLELYFQMALSFAHDYEWQQVYCCLETDWSYEFDAEETVRFNKYLDEGGDGNVYEPTENYKKVEALFIMGF